MLTLSDAEILKIVREELRSILGVRGTPDFAEVFRYPLAMPQYTVGHLERVNQLRQRAAQISGLELSGNYLDGVGVPDCIHSGEQAAEQLWSGGPASGGFGAGK
jgi:oxygen-dependent protoporphyrinogen oxidase